MGKEKITYQIIDEYRCDMQPFTITKLKKEIFSRGGKFKLHNDAINIQDYLNELVEHRLLSFDNSNQEYCSAIDNTYKYLIAESNDRKICLKYNEQWEINAFDYLVDKGFKLRQATSRMWITSCDEFGNELEQYWIDAETDYFDIES